MKSIKTKLLLLLKICSLLQISKAACPPGHYYSDFFVCKPCPRGTYITGTVGNPCLPCPAGTYANKEASLTCTSCPRGTFQPDTGKSSCFKCSVGEYQSNTGGTSCTECPAGMYQPHEGETSCPECPAGMYQPNTGRSICSRCSTGTYQPNTGQTSCSECPAGTFSTATGAKTSDVCQPCQEGEYQEKEGASFCSKCSEGTASNETGAVSSDVCQPCQQGEYQDSKGKSACIPCPENEYQFNIGQSFCIGCSFPLENVEGSSIVCSVCKNGFYLIDEDIPLNSLLQYPRRYCRECPDSSTKCNAGTNITTISIEPGYWRASKHTSEVHRCNFKHICKGSREISPSKANDTAELPLNLPSSIPSNIPSEKPTFLEPSDKHSLSTSVVLSGEYCEDGYHGVLCEACLSPNHYFYDVEGMCKECKFSRFFIHLSIMVAIILPIISILWYVRSHLTPFSIMISSLSAQAKIKVLIGFYQIMSSFTDIYGVTLHEQIRKPFRFMTYLFSFEFLSSFPLDCLKSKSHAYIISGLWPYFIFIGLGLCFLVLKIIRKYFNRCSIDALVESVTFTQISIVILYLALPIASKHIFDAKICQAFKIYDSKVEAESEEHASYLVLNDTIADNEYASYLLSSRTIECNSDDENFQKLQVLFWIFFALWPCLTLLGFAAIVTKISPSIRAGRPSDFAMNCQFIWRDFDPNSNLSVFWDIIDFTRKIFLIGFINFIDQNEGSRKMLRLTIGTAVSIAFLLLLLYVRPYKRSDDFQLSVLSSFLISLCFGLGYIIQICDNGDGNACKTYVGLQDSFGASILVTLLDLGMLVVTILLLILQSTLSPIARLKSTNYPPDLTLPEDCTHHVFMSHKWKGGQDKCHSIARKLQLYMPGLKVWLDVDSLSNTTDLEDHVDKSVVFLLFYSVGYFKRRNCRREFFQAIFLEKPIVVVYDGDNGQLDLMKNECKTVYKKTYEMYELMEKLEDIPRSEWENKVIHLKNKIGIFISEQFGDGYNIGNKIDGSSNESDDFAIQWLKTGSYSSESLKLIYLRILMKLPCYTSNIEAPLLLKGLKLPADKKPPPIKFNFELCFSSYNDGAGEIAFELQKMQSSFMSVIELTTTKMSGDEENTVDPRSNPNSSEHTKGIKNIIGHYEYRHDEENLQESSSLLSLESNGLLNHQSSVKSLPSCFSIDVSVTKVKKEDTEPEIEVNIIQNSNYEDQENEVTSFLHDPDISTSTLAADLEIVKQLESPTFKVFLLYLNKDTFSSENIVSFGPILKSVLLKEIPVIVVHEQDVKKGGRPNFDFFLDHTPSEFMSAYQDIAIPIYSLKEYRDVSLCCILEKIIEKYKRSTH